MHLHSLNSRSGILILIPALLLSSCATSLFVANSKNLKIEKDKEFIIVQNPQSKFFAVGVYPSYKNIDQFVYTSKPSVQRIDSLIFKELIKNNIQCRIVRENDPEKVTIYGDGYIIKYQDYWSWDFKQFMHLLIISIYDFYGNKISDYVSQGNTGGMHNFPMPAKQVPELVELILKE